MYKILHIPSCRYLKANKLYHVIVPSFSIPLVSLDSGIPITFWFKFKAKKFLADMYDGKHKIDPELAVFKTSSIDEFEVVKD